MRKRRCLADRPTECCDYGPMLQAAFDMARERVRGECVITINRQHVVFQFTNAQSAAHVLHQSRGTGADEMRTNLASAPGGLANISQPEANVLVKEWLVEKGIPYDAPVKVLQKQFLVGSRQAMSVVKFGKALTAAGFKSACYVVAQSRAQSHRVGNVAVRCTPRAVSLRDRGHALTCYRSLEATVAMSARVLLTPLLLNC